MGDVTMDNLAEDTDAVIGARIKISRLKKGFSQKDLANKIGVTFQQIQKYEKGRSSISVKRLVQMSRALGEPLYTFLGGVESDQAAASPEATYGSHISDTSFKLDASEKKMIQLFRKITHTKIREGLIAQLRGICDSEHD